MEKTLEMGAMTSAPKILDRASTPRRCKRPGCTTELAARNNSGLCSKHCHWHEPGKPRPGASNGHASNGHAAAMSNGTNGHASKGTTHANGEISLANLAGDFLEDRLNRFILSLPVTEKAKIVTGWLRGV
jgi:hypothetical protein